MITEWDGGQHPDEGSLHAWLDGALDATEAARLESHVHECQECAVRVAEARGLIAGASRVVGLLDETPAPLIRPAHTPAGADRGSTWRLLRVTPARASIAALLIVAVGLTLTRKRVAVDSTDQPTNSAMTGAAPQAERTMSGPTHGPNSRQDHLLDSAVARHLANEHPPRRAEPSPGIAVPAPPPTAGAVAVAPDPSAQSRVAAARASLSAQRDSMPAVADKSRAGIVQPNAAASTALDRAVVAAKAAEGAASSQVPYGSPAGECYRVESAAPAGTKWGSVALPLIVAFDPMGNGARVLTVGGAVTEARANWTRAGTDTLMLQLRRIGYDGSMTLSSTGETHSGTMSSVRLAARVPSIEERPSAQVQVTARVVRCPPS